MAKVFKKIEIEKLKDNPFTLIGTDWMLITAGNTDSCNTMTASWGGLGVLWNRNVAFCFIRPTRYTYTFMESNNYFTLSFFSEEFKDALGICGSKSGRDMDKIKAVGLTPIESAHGSTYFDQARIVLECRKIYYDDVKPTHFLDTKIHEAYPLKDYHRMYVGEIVNCLIEV